MADGLGGSDYWPCEQPVTAVAWLIEAAIGLGGCRFRGMWVGDGRLGGGCAVQPLPRWQRLVVTAGCRDNHVHRLRSLLLLVNDGCNSGRRRGWNEGDSVWS